MRDKESVKAPDKKRKKRIALMVAAAIIVAAGAVSGYLYWRSTLTTETPQTPFPPRDGENVVSATGTTSTGLIEKEIALDFLDADLIVEDVYVSSADEVESGTAVLRLTDNSYKEAYRELERALMEAELAYRQGEIDYENKKLEAENEQKRSQIASDFAQIVYDDTLMEAQIAVQRTEQEVVDAQEIVDEYIDGIENDAYREEYEVDEKKAAYERNVALFLRNWMIMDTSWMMTMMTIPIHTISFRRGARAAQAQPVAAVVVTAAQVSPGTVSPPCSPCSKRNIRRIRKNMTTR